MTQDQVLMAASDFLRSLPPDYRGTEGTIRGDAASLLFVPASKAGRVFDGRATWCVTFYGRSELDNIDGNPLWIEVFVDEETGEAWNFDSDRKKTPTSWRNTWVKKRLTERKRRLRE